VLKKPLRVRVNCLLRFIRRLVLLLSLNLCTTHADELLN
jgi:hypothetical protein